METYDYEKRPNAPMAAQRVSYASVLPVWEQMVIKYYRGEDNFKMFSQKEFWAAEATEVLIFLRLAIQQTMDESLGCQEE